MNNIGPNNELIVKTIYDNNLKDHFVIMPYFDDKVAYQFEIYDHELDNNAIIDISLEDAKAIYNYLKKDMEAING